MFILESSSNSSKSGFATTVFLVKNCPKLNLQEIFLYFYKSLSDYAFDRLQPIHAIQSLFFHVASMPEHDYL